MKTAHQALVSTLITLLAAACAVGSPAGTNESPIQVEPGTSDSTESGDDGTHTKSAPKGELDKAKGASPPPDECVGLPETSSTMELASSIDSVIAYQSHLGLTLSDAQIASDDSSESFLQSSTRAVKGSPHLDLTNETHFTAHLEATPSNFIRSAITPIPSNPTTHTLFNLSRNRAKVAFAFAVPNEATDRWSMNTDSRTVEWSFKNAQVDPKANAPGYYVDKLYATTAISWILSVHFDVACKAEQFSKFNIDLLHARNTKNRQEVESFLAKNKAALRLAVIHTGEPDNEVPSLLDNTHCSVMNLVACDDLNIRLGMVRSRLLKNTPLVESNYAKLVAEGHIGPWIIAGIGYCPLGIAHDDKPSTPPQ